MSAVIAWTVQQVFRVRNLPHREIRAKQHPKRDLVRAAYDRTWRTRQEVARMTGMSFTFVCSVTAEMLRGGEVEVMEQGWQRPNQYRRAR